MAVTEGTYIIVNANVPKALDVAGASDRSGANVQLWDVITGGGDAQMWTLVADGEGFRLCCSLTGNWLDLEGGRVANCTNIRQWSQNGAGAQLWIIEEDGKQATYKGDSYDTVTIATSLNTNYVVDAAGGGTAVAANALLFQSEGTKWQRWMLVPVDCFTEDGVYRIVSELDSNLCIDITAASTASGAKACSWTNNDQPNQMFLAKRQGGGLFKFIALHSGKALDVDHGATEDGRSVLQWPVEPGNSNQLWLPTQAGSMTIDGVSLPTYEMRNQSGTNRCIDVSGASKTPGTSLVVWTRHTPSQKNQRFGFVKTEPLMSGISAPSSLTPSAFERDGYGAVTASGMTFKCSETAYQARYRFQYNYDSQRRSYSGSTPWRNVANDSTARSGWGDAWQPTFEVEEGGIVNLPLNVSRTLAASDPYAMLVVEVRAFRDKYGEHKIPAHGPVTQTRVALRRTPAMSFERAYLWATYDSEKKTWSAFIYGGMTSVADMAPLTRLRVRLVDADGEPLTEWNPGCENIENLWWEASRHMLRLPAEGERVGIEYDLTNVEGAVARDIVWGEFEYGDGSLSVLPSSEDIGDGTFRTLVRATGGDVATCLLEVEDTGRTGLYECPLVDASDLERTWAVCPPFNRACRALVIQRTGSLVGIGIIDLFMESRLSVWNWGSNLAACAAVHVNVGDYPKQSRIHTPDVTLHTTTGARHPIATGWSTETLDLSVSGVTLEDPSNPMATETAIERLAISAVEGERPVYRTPRGTWHRVVVTAVDSSWQQPEYLTATVQQRAVRI